MRKNKVVTAMVISVLFFTMGMINGSWTRADGDNGGSCCHDVTIEKAATLLKVAPTDLIKSSHSLRISPEDQKKNIYKITPCGCSYRAKSNFLKFIHFLTYVYNDPARARADFNRMKGTFSNVSSVDTIQGIGDEAFYAGDKRFQRLVGVQGNVLVDVVSPRDFALQKQILTLVFGKKQTR